MLAFLLNKKQVTSVDFAEDGQKCIDLIKSNGLKFYHIIFMDNTMPVMVSAFSMKNHFYPHGLISEWN